MCPKLPFPSDLLKHGGKNAFTVKHPPYAPAVPVAVHKFEPN